MLVVRDIKEFILRGNREQFDRMALNRDGDQEAVRDGSPDEVREPPQHGLGVDTLPIFRKGAM